MQLRLKLLVAAAAVTACFTACKKDDTTTASSSSTASSNSDPATVSTRTSATGIAKVICLVEAFKSQLDATQLTTLQRTYAVSDAKKWSNLPQGLVQGSAKRVG